MFFLVRQSLEKIFTILCILITFLGIVGWPWSDVPETIAVTNIEVSSNSASPVPEPISLVLFGYGWVSLTIVGRRNFRK